MVRAKAYWFAFMATLITFGSFAPMGVTEAANSAPREDLIPIRGGVTPDRQGNARLEFKVSPLRCVRSCFVTLRAVVIAPRELCITKVRFISDPNGCRIEGNKDGCAHEYETSCSERRFSEEVFYQPGTYRARVEVWSDDTKLDVKGLKVVVGEPEVSR